MDLAELKFVVITDDLERASKEVAKLGAEVSKLNKPMQELTRESAKTNKELSKAEEAAAKAALAQTKLEEAQTKSTQAAVKSSSVLERQNLILEYMAQGNSKGQASILATAKAAGALDDEMLQLNKTLVTQRTLIGGDPFDKSIGLMQKLQNEYKTTTEVTTLFNKNLGLTEKQMTDLAREKERLIALYGIEGRSLNGLASEYEQLIQKSVKINQANDARTNSMKAQLKAQNDAAKANEYIANEMERLNRLTSSNGDVTSATNNKIIRFERELRASGMSAAEATAKLEAYKNALLATQKAAGNRQVDYLSRALGPQITDIAVGLATGQSPMTILLQQGGQLRDQFALAGVAGADMGKMLTKAATSMVSSVKDVGIAIGSALGGAIVATGGSIVDFGGKITGVNSIIDTYKRKIVSTGESNFGMIGTLNKLGRAFSIFAGVGVVGAIGGLIAFGVALKQVIEEESALSKAINLTGASLGLTTDSTLTLSKELAGSKGNVGSYVTAITDIAKAGGITSDNLKTVATTIVNTSKILGVSSEDLAKNFSKISEKPLEGLIPFAKQLGTINVSVLQQIQQLERVGKHTEAVKLATDAYAKSLKDAADNIKKDMGWVEKFFYGIGDAAKWMWDKILNIGRKGTLDEELTKAIDKMKELQAAGGTNTGRKDRMVTAQAAVIEGILKQINAEKELGATKAKNVKEVAAFEKNLKEQGGAQFKVPEDLYLKQLKEDYKESTKEIDSESKKLLAQNKSTHDLGLTDLGTYLGEEIRLIQDQNNQKIGINKAYTSSFETALELQIKAINAMAAKESAKTKTASDATKVEEQRVESIKSVTEAYKLLTQGIGSNTEVLRDNSAEQQAKSIAILGQETRKVIEGSKEFARTLDDNASKRKLQIELESQIAGLAGSELVRIKAQIEAEQSHINKLSELEKSAKKAALALSELTLSGLNPNDPSYQDATNAVKKANVELENAKAASRKEIVQAGIDAEMLYYMQEYNNLRNGIADSITTALFEGGKAGSKKLRDLIVAELKKPITVVVKALVDTLFGDVIKSATGGDSGGGLGGGSNILSTLKSGYDLLTNGVSSSIATSFGKLASTSFGQSLGLTTQVSGPVTASGQAATQFTPMGQNISAGLGMAGNALAGYGIQKAISGGYKTGESGLVDAITVAASAYFGPIAGVVAGAFNRAFGRKLTDSGVRGTFGGAEGFQGENFTFEKGGWFRSDRERGSALDPKTQSALSMQFKSLQVQTALMADSLGLSTDSIANFTKNIRLSFHGLTEEQIAKKIQDEFIAINESLAQLVMGTQEKTKSISSIFSFLKKSTTKFIPNEFVREGETAAQALTRLSTSLLTANSATKHWGVTLYDVSLAGGDAASTLIDLFGGIDKFTQASAFFYDNFFSAEEKTLNLTKDLTTEFNKLNKPLPETRDAFRAMVIAAKEAGDDQLVVNLLNLQQGIVTLRQESDLAAESIQEAAESIEQAYQRLKKSSVSAEEVAKERIDLERELFELTSSNAELEADKRNSIHETNRGLFDQIKALEDKKVADEEAVKAMEKLTSVTTTIVDEINRLRGVNTSQSGLESQFAILTAQARSGDLSALAQLPEITKGLEQIAASTAVNATDIIFARARLAQSLQDTLGYTGGFTASATTSMASIGSVSASASGTAVSSNVTSASSNQELLAAMVIELQGLRAEVRADVSHNAKTAKILERANQDGETLSVSATIDGGVV